MAFVKSKAIYHYRLHILLTVSFIVRMILAFSVELGNDEVYYITYALYPDLSHFDHPPMVGWLIQLFTVNLALDAEGWIRMAAVVLGTLSTIIIYNIGKEIGDKETGWYSALLYTISIYGFVITGIFMMPDSPQVFFWLLSIWLIIKFLNSEDLKINEVQKTGTKTHIINYSRPYLFLMAGLSIGFALLSKYTSIFILSGLFFWCLKHRHYFRKWHVWAAALIALACFLPVIIWNINNEFISFTFHTDRVEVRDQLFRLDSFAKELTGQILYNNPFNFAIILAAVIAFFRGRLQPKQNTGLLLILISLPLILIFLGISLFRSTLPHWSGPGYITLIPLAALWIRNKYKAGSTGKFFPKPIAFGAAFLVIVISIAIIQLNFNVFFNKGINPETGKRIGMKDITLDMYGWKQLSQKFDQLYQKDKALKNIDSNTVIISHRWFPAANLDYYVARPAGLKVITMAPVERTHKYAWITKYRGGYMIGMDAYFISSSYDFMDPHTLYQEYFTIAEPDTIPIYRQDLLVKYFYVWKLKNLKKLPPSEFLIQNN
ncbi:MAG TPA: glycosyltransferase family 39 protein [Lentimicrobium sp.]|nr:glycosyltransferase family 39 protein [Lentimicrobium sp.]